MSKLSPKLELFASFAMVAKAAGHPRRLDLLEHVAQGERSVDALAAVSGLSIANASQHLQQMRRGGLVVSRRDGKRVLYRLSSDQVLQLLSALRAIAERNVAEARQTINDYFLARDSMEPLTITDIARAVRSKNVVILDVRPPAEFSLGHVSGAVNIPLGDLERRLKALPKSKEIVAYCRGPYCVLSFEAVALLRKRGYSARRLDGGLPECAAAGVPIGQAA
ncbi:MAG TPA: metalloregulator ArsR/SmtB family transcription factor [Steroidobacteraceae bacterium]|nr:metalloregulator ArsR/SmtB family transcription factor [Steroidobacteraceae bacterium]